MHSYLLTSKILALLFSFEIFTETMASLAEQLKNVKLKKSDTPMKDFSSAKTAGFLKEEEIKGKLFIETMLVQNS